MITGELVASHSSMIPRNMDQSATLNAGIANLCSFATAKISFMLYNIFLFLLIEKSLYCRYRKVRCIKNTSAHLR